MRRESALSGRPANPPPPSGESEEEGGDAEGDASPAPAPQPMTYISLMEGPLAPLAGQVLRDRAPQRYGELRRELALSRRPANPPPPSGDPEEEKGDAEGDASPAPAPQPMPYIRPMGGPLAPLTGQVLGDRAPQRYGELRRELALSGRPANPPPPPPPGARTAQHSAVSWRRQRKARTVLQWATTSRGYRRLAQCIRWGGG